MVSKEKGVSGHVHIGWKTITHHPVLSFRMLSLGGGGKSQFFLPAGTKQDRAASGAPCIRIENTYTVILRDMVCSEDSEPQNTKINFNYHLRKASD